MTSLQWVGSSSNIQGLRTPGDRKRKLHDLLRCTGQRADVYLLQETHHHSQAELERWIGSKKGDVFGAPCAKGHHGGVAVFVPTWSVFAGQVRQIAADDASGVRGGGRWQLLEIRAEGEVPHVLNLHLPPAVRGPGNPLRAVEPVAAAPWV